MRSARTALAAGLALTVVAVAFTLSRSPLVVLATSSSSMGESLATGKSSARGCQGGERLPAHTTAIRLSIGAFTGPPMSVAAISPGNRVVSSGERGSGWAGQTVTIPVRPVSHPVAPVRICFAGRIVGGEQLTVFGSRGADKAVARTGGGEPLEGRFRVEYLGKGRASWLSLLGYVAWNMGLGRAWSGTWVSILVLLLMLATAILASRLVIRELDG
jgi:hypothetical protein